MTDAKPVTASEEKVGGVGALTPAEVEIVQQMLADRDADARAYVQTEIEKAVAPLRDQVQSLTSQVATMQEALGVLDQAAVKFGGKLALRLASGKVLCATDGGPTQDGQPVRLEARTAIGGWESFGTEPGV
jgi:hypothetical protein